MLFVFYTVLVAFGIKLAVKDVPDMVSKQITKPKEALKTLREIPEEFRDGRLLPGNPMYMTAHHAELLNSCTNHPQCMDVFQEMVQLGAMAPRQLEEGKGT